MTKLVAALLCGAAWIGAASAQAQQTTLAPDSAPDAPAPAAAQPGADIVVTGQTTRSVSQVGGTEIQKILPGISPLKALQTLPGVTYLTADPWGNNEQNISLFIHGFNQQQLGYTLDGVPLGDQQYGNFNGLSPQRAVISENVARVTLASGAGDLGTPSTSNLGGTIDTFTSDPHDALGVTVEQVVGSYGAYRTFARIDTGDLGGNTRAYISGVRQDARAWDFAGHQGGYQANFKLVHEDGNGRATAYFAYSDKTEPNEDATVVSATQTYQPYTRPFLYPNFPAALSYYNNQLAYNGAATYAAAGSNYSNYYSDAQRTDYLGYLKYDWNVAPHVTWSNQPYFHHDDGVGVVAGPITAAGLPQLFSFYYPSPNGGAATTVANLARLSTIFGGSGLASRTTEYRIDREGIISTLHLDLGRHQIELGGWYEHQDSSAYRRWYALNVNAPTSPYTRPNDYETALITQYGSQVRVDEIQTHLQDSWHLLPTLTILAGFKSTFQRATQAVPVQPIPGSFTGSIGLPVGRLNTTQAFLPEVGALWDVSSSAQLFANVQKNVRQFQTSAAAGLSPFALGSQGLFNFFVANTRPETSWTYEGGVRFHRELAFGPLTGFDGQASYYHVDFSNRLLGISPTAAVSGVAGIVSGAAIVQNVGSVKTDGADVAGTFRFGPHFSLYDAVSYNNSRYDGNYLSGATTVLTAGKKVPGSPDWLNKTVATLDVNPFEVQLVGDYIGRRYATYTNDLYAVGDGLARVPGYFTLSGRVAVDVPLPGVRFVRTATLSLNVTNITGKQAASTLSIGAASGTYSFFPVAPRQYFGTLRLGF